MKEKGVIASVFGIGIFAMFVRCCVVVDGNILFLKTFSRMLMMVRAFGLGLTHGVGWSWLILGGIIGTIIGAQVARRGGEKKRGAAK